MAGSRDDLGQAVPRGQIVQAGQLQDIVHPPAGPALLGPPAAGAVQQRVERGTREAVERSQ